MYVEGSTWEQVKYKAEKCLQKLINWFDSKILKLNYNKSKFISFTSYKNNLPNIVYLKIHNRKCTNKDTCFCEKIEEISHIKYLGIEIDCHLRWDTHIASLCNKVRRIVYCFHVLKRILSLNLIKNVYYALVQSLLSYGILVWGGTNKTLINNLAILQKRIIKIILNKPYTYSTEMLYKEFNVMNITELYALEILKYYYKNKHHFNSPDHIHNTRFKTQLHAMIPKKNKTIGTRNFTFLSYKIYNCLPPELKMINFSYKIFISKVKKWICENKKSLEKIFAN